MGKSVFISNDHLPQTKNEISVVIGIILLILVIVAIGFVIIKFKVYDIKSVKDKIHDTITNIIGGSSSSTLEE